MKTSTALAAAFAAVLTWTLVPVHYYAVHAAPRIQKFKLHEPILEQAIAACLSAIPAKDLVTLSSAGRQAEAEAAFNFYSMAGECGVLTNVEITYSKQHVLIEARGTVYVMYEGTIQTQDKTGKKTPITVYVPMEGFVHDGVAA